MRLNQVTLEVSDVPRAVEFYRGLGLQQIVGGDDRYARFVCPDGDSTFSVELSERPLPEWTPATVYFECDDLDAQGRGARSCGLRVRARPRRPALALA